MNSLPNRGDKKDYLMSPDAVFQILLILINNSHTFSGKGYASFRILNKEPLMEVQMDGQLYIKLKIYA